MIRLRLTARRVLKGESREWRLPELPPDQTTTDFVAIRNVSMSFNGSAVLRDITFSLRRGEFVSIIGASGCGKTTLLNLVAGFIRATGGEIVVDGKAVEHPGADRSMVFQDDAVFPWYTVAENVEYGLRFKGIARAERKRRGSSLIELIGLTGREKAYPRELSGGMRKRVDVARALAVEPKVLLMDEPFASLDAITKMRMQSEFLRLWDQGRMTVLFVTHDIEEALFLSDRVVVMASNPGRVAKEIVLPFSRPRNDELRMAPHFQELRRELINLLGA